MPQRTSILAIFLLVSAVLGCSLLRSAGPATWHITLQIDPATPNLDEVVNKTVQVIESRLNAVGVGANPRAEKNGRIRIDLPNVTDRERLKRVLTSEGTLELFHVISPPNPAPPQTFNTEAEAKKSLGNSVAADRKVLPYLAREEAAALRWVVVEFPAIIDGNDLRSAQAMPERGEPENYSIFFRLTPTGAEKLGEWTGSNVNEYLGVVMNHQVRSIAFIKSQIFDSGQITGRFPKEPAEDLALVLTSGPLPAAVRIVEEGAN
jgi:protein-export membrane protein SecD